MAELRPNKAKRNLSDGKIVSVPMGPLNGDLIEHFGPLGFDAIWLEGEHGPVDFNNIPDLTRACDVSGLSSIVRVHQNEPAVIYRTFDLGAQGVTVPHINTKQEAEAVQQPQVNINSVKIVKNRYSSQHQRSSARIKSGQVIDEESNEEQNQ